MCDVSAIENDNSKCQITAAIRKIEVKIRALERASDDPRVLTDPKEFGSAFHVLGVLNLQVIHNSFKVSCMRMGLVKPMYRYLHSYNLFKIRLATMTKVLRRFLAFFDWAVPMARSRGLELHMETLVPFVRSPIYIQSLKWLLFYPC